MPIEIRELVIRATVSGQNTEAAASSEGDARRSRKAELILAQVSDMLRKKKER